MTESNLKLLTVTELASILRIGRSSAYELCKENQFPVVRIGKNIRIPKQSLYRWIDEQARIGLEERCS